MTVVFRELWDNLREFVSTVGAVALFFARVLAQVPRALLRFRLVVEQVHNAGALSLVIIMTCGLFVGMVLGVLGYDVLQRFGSEEALGTAAALGLIKELGPVVTALLFGLAPALQATRPQLAQRSVTWERGSGGMKSGSRTMSPEQDGQLSGIPLRSCEMSWSACAGL